MAKKRNRRPLKESVFFESLAYKIFYFPIRLFNNIAWYIFKIGQRLWRIKNIDIPYRKSKKK